MLSGALIYALPALLGPGAVWFAMPVTEAVTAVGVCIDVYKRQVFVMDVSIIPYQELLGNYNPSCIRISRSHIIPYQELLGNYNQAVEEDAQTAIIPYQEPVSYTHL